MHYKQQIPVDNLWFEIWICLYPCTQKVALYVSSAEGLWKREKLTVRCAMYFVLLRYLLSFMWADPGGRAFGAPPPPKIGKNKIFWHKIVIFHTKYPKIFRASLRSAQFFKICPPPPLTWNPGSAPGQYKNKNKNVLLPIKGPQGANNLIQWLKWLETYM